MRFLGLVVFAVVALAGCKGPCRQLSEKLCDCELNSQLKQGCLTRASNSESANPPRPQDDAYCQAILDAKECDCRLIDTPEGKKRCGLARRGPVLDAGT